MPYDDSNIKKMIRYQTERKVHFSRSKIVSQSCKELIWTMLEADLALRIPITQAISHAWLEEARKHKAEEDSAAAGGQAEQYKSRQPSLTQQPQMPTSSSGTGGRNSVSPAATATTKAVDITAAAAGVEKNPSKPTPAANSPPLQGTTDAT